MVDILIIGAGTAGMTAGIYGRRAGSTVTIVDNNNYGGQIIITPDIENYPGFITISGYEFGQKLYEQSVHHGVEFVFGEPSDFVLEGDVKSVKVGDKTIEAKTVIIANGAKNRLLGCKGEEDFKGKGISYCAICDGAFYKNQTTAVIGGGNTALEDALYLAKKCEKVYLVHRKDNFRAAQHAINAVMATENIEIIFDSVVEEIAGDKKISHIQLKNVKDDEIRQIDVTGVFVAIGQIPQNEAFRDILDLDAIGYIVADENCTTNVKGVFVAGDCRTKAVRQLVTAAADGAVSATFASNYMQ